MTDSEHMASEHMALDKASCAREPIHIPGSIQPHGYLFVLEDAGHTVLATSRNAADALGLIAEEVIGQPITRFLTTVSTEPLDLVLGTESSETTIGVRLQAPASQEIWQAALHRSAGLVLLELEPAPPPERATALFGQVRAAIERIRRSGAASSATDALAVEIRRLSGFDRVMVYRFDEEWNGEVVAEDRAPDAHSYLGHAFPAADIPAQARALYVRNTVRQIPDTRYAPSPIVPSVRPSTGLPFDLSDAGLRSVSPIHLEYLANMGVAASMSVSILRDGKLWALVACHHSTPRALPSSVLRGCDLLAQATAWYLDALDRAAGAECVAAVRRVEVELALSGDPATYRHGLARFESTLLALTRSQGAAICDGDGVWTVGACPDPTQIGALAQWLSSSGEDRISTDRLAVAYPAAGDYGRGASGICAERLGEGWLIWFRAEWPHTLRWAGQPGTEVRTSPDEGRVSPRKSFASWKEEVRGRSAPWSEIDVFAGAEVGVLILRLAMAQRMRRLTESEQALTEAKHRAEDASRVKSDFLAHMSHEIRTPLNGVLGMAQVMATERLPKAQRERLAVIQNSGLSLLSILNDILDLSKIEAGRLELEETAFDLARIVSEACSLFATSAKPKGVEVVVEIGDDARGLWRGDPTRVRKVVSNLVSNALKFTSEGEVRVSVEAPMKDGVRDLALRVADTGIGIPAEALPSLFDAFVQADSTTTRRFGGTGLGLTICRDIVEQMGGGIDVSSEVGRGTVFHLRLPLAWEGPLPVSVPGPGETGGAGVSDFSSLKILAADDNETNRVVIRAVLQSLGVDVQVVESGRQAIDAWSAGDFDLVLMDVQMPDIDGPQAVAEIRAVEVERGLPPTPIVAFSANAMKHQVAEYLRAGFDGHLAKPVVVADLCAILESVSQSGGSVGALVAETPSLRQGLRGLQTALSVRTKSTRVARGAPRGSRE